MLSSKPSYCQLTGKSKLQERSRKQSCMEKKAKYDDFVEIKALNKSKIKSENSHNYLVHRLKTNQDKTLGKNL